MLKMRTLTLKMRKMLKMRTCQQKGDNIPVISVLIKSPVPVLLRLLMQQFTLRVILLTGNIRTFKRHVRGGSERNGAQRFGEMMFKFVG
jgi:hypothetical protein